MSVPTTGGGAARVGVAVGVLVAVGDITATVGVDVVPADRKAR